LRLSIKLAYIFMICVALSLAFTAVLAAPTISLSWYKNNGLGFGNDIGGQWIITAVTSSDVTRVEFYLDNQIQQNGTSAPFSWDFNTADYNLGPHTIKIVAYNIEGLNVTAQADRNFVEYSTNLFWITIGVIVAVLVISLVIALYWVRKKEPKQRKTKFSLAAPCSQILNISSCS